MIINEMIYWRKLKNIYPAAVTKVEVRLSHLCVTVSNNVRDKCCHIHSEGLYDWGLNIFLFLYRILHRQDEEQHWTIQKTVRVFSRAIYKQGVANLIPVGHNMADILLFCACPTKQLATVSLSIALWNLRLYFQSRPNNSLTEWVIISLGFQLSQPCQCPDLLLGTFSF